MNKKNEEVEKHNKYVMERMKSCGNDTGIFYLYMVIVGCRLKIIWDGK